ncbi:TPA: GH-E family nuclease [Bacillus cereus]|uniref:GH-E family nuclease n=1 Tax=Bacillus thuringiensis TaxID=1428 RepID=UPI0039884D50
MESVSQIFKGVEILPDGSVVRAGTNYSGKFQEAHDASKASIQSRISNLESGGVKGTGDVGDIASGANIKKLDDFSGPLENGPYIRNGKLRGRPQLSGEKKLGFEKDVFNKQIDPDGILRDPNTSETIDWKPGRPRKGKVDFGHTEGNSYKKMFEKYKNGEITLEELKEFQFNPDNFRLETPSANRSHKYE